MNPVPSVTQPFAAFRTYKDMIPVFLRVPSASSGIFSSYRGYGNLLAERIHVRILGHAGRILRSYLHNLCNHGIQDFYRDDAA
jgi:hypothetical protein